MNAMKKLFSMIVALALVLVSAPAVLAETTSERISVGTTEELNAVIDRLAAETGLDLEITLTADIAMEKQIELVADSAHTVTVDLNGRKLTAKDGAAIRALAMFDGFVIFKNGTIEMPGINETTTDGTTGAGMGGLIFVMGDSLVLDCVTVTKTATDNLAGDGGIICLRSSAASLEMIASTVRATVDGKPDASVGGALRVTNGAKLYMREGSVIRDGYASDYGGNVAVAGNSYVYIYDNSLLTAGICDESGGNIYIGNANARFHVYHGTVSNGTAAKGGNLNIGAGQFFLYDGAISGGTADANEGSSVFLKTNTNVYFYLVGGQILHEDPDAAFVKGYNAKARFYNGKTVFDPSVWTPSDCAYVTAPAGDETLYTVTHVDVEGMEVTPATCETAGTKEISCETCDHSYTYTIPATGHTPEVVAGKDATCTETGLTEGSRCSVCSETIVAQEVIPATDHAWTDEFDTECNNGCGVTRSAADTASAVSANTVGSLTVEENVATITVEGLLDYAVNPAGKGGNWVGFKLTAPAFVTDYANVKITRADGTERILADILDGENWAWIYCNMGDEKNASGTYSVDWNGDGIDDLTVRMDVSKATLHPETCQGGEATCTDPAVCEYCGKPYGEAVGHSHSGVYTEPTYEDDGYTTYTCAICGDSYTVTDEGSKLEKADVAQQPASVEANVGDAAVFTVAAEGDGLTYKWEYSRNGSTWYNTKMSGYETAELSVPVLLSRNGYHYRCVITDIYGNEVISEAAVLTVTEPAGLVKLVAQPEAQAVIGGRTAVFAVAAEGEGLVCQWQYTKNGATWHTTAMEGCDTDTLYVTATLARNGYQYRCVITDAYGTQVISEAAALTVAESDIATSGPEDQVAENGIAVFSVEVEGEGLTCRWQYQRPNGTKWFYTTMEGYATSELTVIATAARNGYKYRCIITDAYGNETVSGEAVLTVG